ncbi:MAG: DUF1428 family protein [Pseudomonadota bacterium]
MTYIDGYVFAISRDQKEAYTKQANAFGVFAMQQGALKILEAWQDDVPEGKQTDFFRAVECKDDEAVVFAWTLWPSKEVRNTAHATMRNNPELLKLLGDAVFDGKRMIFGGFEPFIEHGA